MVKAISLCAGAAAIMALAAPAAARNFQGGGRMRVRVPVTAPAGSYAAVDRRGDRRGLGRNRFAFGYPLGWYGGGIIDDPERHRDDGFFAGTGNSARVNGAAYYDYDRAYPYDWYRDDDAVAEDEGEGPRPASRPAVRCEMTRVSGSAVRICRGRR